MTNKQLGELSKGSGQVTFTHEGAQCRFTRLHPDYPGPVVVEFKRGDVTNSSIDEGKFYIRAVSGTSVTASNFTVYTYYGHKVITDNSTGLMWMGELLYDSYGVFPLRTNWAGALATCESNYLLSYYDWRLPTINELLSLVSSPYSTQILPPEFSSIYGYLQSSTSIASEPSSAWALSVYYGTPDTNLFGWGKFEPDFSTNVLCVRGGVTTRPYSHFNISLTIEGSGKVALLNGSSGQITICDNNCILSIQEGTSLILTAVADLNSSLSSWSGDCSNNSNECTLHIDADKDVSAANPVLTKQ